MLGMFTPSSHVALEDIHHTFGELQLAPLPNVFASSSGRAMTKGVTPLLTFHATKMQIRQNTMTTATLLTFLKKRDNHKIAECMQGHRHAQKEQAWKNDPDDYECCGHVLTDR